MPHVYFEQLEQFRKSHDRLVQATVIAVRGSSSAKPGAHAVISAEGHNLYGWVGGGCAESFIIEQALEALAEGQPRVITVDLDDELLGVGMPCGGYMDVYLEPLLPPRHLALVGADQVAQQLAVLANLAGYAVTVYGAPASGAFPMARLELQPLHQIAPADGFLVLTDASRLQEISHLFERPGLHFCLPAEHIATVAGSFPALPLGGTSAGEQALALLGAVLAHDRQKTATSLNLVPAQARASHQAKPSLMVVGRGRIVEELARLGQLLTFEVTVNGTGLGHNDYPTGTCLIENDLELALPGAGPHTYLIIASQHKGDHRAALSAIGAKVAYLGLVASRKRSGLVLDWLREQELSNEDLSCFHAPAGLDLGAITPLDIACSILCEILAIHHQCLPEPSLSIQRDQV